MNKANRRTFLKKSTTLVSATMFPTILISKETSEVKIQHNESLKLGIASYSFRNYTLEETVKSVEELGMKNLALKSMHLPLDLSDEEIAKTAKWINDKGIHLYGAGVIYMNDEKEVENAFRYAKNAGLQVIIGVPKHELLTLAEKYVKSTGIKLAIHNHGPGDDLYPSPESIYEKIKKLDARIGICLDIGHTQRIGLNPAAEADKYFDRLFDIHIKDVSDSTEKGDTVIIGRGVIDIPSFLKVLVSKKYEGVISFEYEKDPDNIMPGIAESIGYVRGVLDTLN